jgi:hypothetical protein
MQDDLDGLRRAGIAMVAFPICVYAGGLLIRGATPLFWLFIVGIPVGAIGAGFLFVYALKAFGRRLTK